MNRGTKQQNHNQSGIKLEVFGEMRESKKIVDTPTRHCTLPPEVRLSTSIYLLDGILGNSEACQCIDPAAGEYNHYERGHSVF
jgi:hypothetical protein